MHTLKQLTKFFGLFLFSLCISQFAFAAEKPENCTPTKHDVSALFTQWNDAIKTENPDAVTALYAENGVLLPTLSNTPRTNRPEMRAYFVDFLKKKPAATIDQSFISTGCNWASNTGIYTFKLFDEKSNKTKKVRARFSYVYENINGKWLIINHHSSLMPEAEEEGED